MSSPVSSAMIGPEASASEQSRMELQSRLNGLGGLGGRQMDPEVKARKLREACEGFESIFIQKMWQEMRNTVPKDGMMHGREEHFWQDMYDQELSKSMTKAGGIGLANMMYEQLSRNLVSASRSAANGGSLSPFTPSAAPLVTENQAVDLPSGPSPLLKAESAASIYEAPAAVPASDHSEAPMTAQNAPAKPVNMAQATPAHPATAHAARAATAPAPAAAHVVNTARKTVQQKHIPSGLELAQIAKRDAGDKLGSRAVRPSLQPQRHRTKEQDHVEPAPQAAATLAQNGSFAPGTPEALKAALELARTGQPAEIQGENQSLAQLVANVQAQNAMSDNPPEEIQDMPVVTRKVRYTTNISSKSGRKNAGKKANQVIRMLNVDNVGVNSKAGQGLAAYHAAQQAQQEQQTQMAQAAAQLASQPVAQVPPLSPQAANSQPRQQGTGNFAIPPLTAADGRG